MLSPMRVLILGAGFAGSYVARLLGKRTPELDVTLVDPRNYMLYTPLLPEAASGTVEPRHAVVPVRVMCPRARLLLGRATAVDMSARTVTVQPVEGNALDVGFDVLVVALGAIARTAPVPGLVEHAVGFKTIAEAIHLRNHVLQELELAATIEDPANGSAGSRSSSSAAGTRGSRRWRSSRTWCATRAATIRACATCRAGGSWPTPPTTS